MEEAPPEAILSCHRQKQPLSLIYADIDRFSQINERCGRVAGDLVLQHVAQILRKRTARPESWLPAIMRTRSSSACRHEKQRGAASGHKPRVAIIGERLLLEGGELRTTCSFVVRSVESEEKLPAAQMLLRQMRELAGLAKESGGNIVL